MIRPTQNDDIPERDEGYVKFQQIRTAGPALEPIAWHQLEKARKILYRAGLLGMYADGVGFGNISRLAPSFPVEGNSAVLQQTQGSPAFRPFIISGTQTGRFPELDGSGYVLVTAVQLSDNTLYCRGPVDASAESMTHAAVYAADPAIGCVLHVHHRAHWERLLDCVPTTKASVPYGTPAMAEEVLHLLASPLNREIGLIAMAGHEEGLISFGTDTEQALDKLRFWDVLD